MMRKIAEFFGWQTAVDLPKVKPRKLKQVAMFQALIEKNKSHQIDPMIELEKTYEFIGRPLDRERNQDFYNTLSDLIANRPSNLKPPTLPDAIPILPTTTKKTFDHLKPANAPSNTREGLSKVLLQLKHGYFKQEPESASEDKIMAEAYNPDDIVVSASAPCAPPF